MRMSNRVSRKGRTSAPGSALLLRPTAIFVPVDRCPGEQSGTGVFLGGCRESTRPDRAGAGDERSVRGV